MNVMFDLYIFIKQFPSFINKYNSYIMINIIYTICHQQITKTNKITEKMEQNNRQSILKMLNLDSMINEYLAENKKKTFTFTNRKSNFKQDLQKSKKKVQNLSNNNKLYKTVDSKQCLPNRRVCSASNFYKQKNKTITYEKNSQSAKNIEKKNSVKDIKNKETLGDFKTQAPQNNIADNKETISAASSNNKNYIFKSSKFFKQKLDGDKKEQNFGSQYLPCRNNHLKRRAAMISKTIQSQKNLLKSRYQIEKIIGRGLSGVVYKAKDILSQRYVAIKVLEQKNERQYQFIKKLSHPNLIEYYNSFEEATHRYIVLQYLPLTLNEAIKKYQLSNIDILHIFRQIINAIMYLHSMSYAHRDIKLDNIVISEDLQTVKFIDFGLCVDVSESDDKELKRFCGTTSYISPQIIQAECKDPKQADIWSLGIVLYALITGRPPFKGRQQVEIYNKIKNSKIVFPNNINPTMKILLTKMLDKNPKNRPTIFQLVNYQWA